MNIIKAFLIFLMSFSLSFIYGQGDNLTDKYLHFGAGYAISSMTSSFSFHLKTKRPISIGISTGAAAGLVKEITDQYVYKGFDIVDLVVTAQGALFGGMCVKIALSPQAERRKKPIEF